VRVPKEQGAPLRLVRAARAAADSFTGADL